MNKSKPLSAEHRLHLTCDQRGWCPDPTGELVASIRRDAWKEAARLDEDVLARALRAYRRARPIPPETFEEMAVDLARWYRLSGPITLRSKP